MDTINGATQSPVTASISGLADRAGGAATERARLSRDDFYKIMVSELTNQDPFEPMDNNQFLEQLTSLQSLESTSRLSDGIDRLLFQNRLSSASALIGREVRAAGAEGGEIKGSVSRVLVQGGDVRLILDDGVTLGLDEVTEIAA